MIARWHGVPFHDFSNKKWLVTFETDEVPEVYDDTKDKELNVDVKPYRKKRSLNANAYAWVLMSKIAGKLHSTKEEIYEQELLKHPVFETSESGDYITITMKKEIPLTKLGGHWMPVKTHEGFISYIMIKGSSEYDTAEMANLIDGIVEEAKALGIETMTPRELEELKTAWQNREC